MADTDSPLDREELLLDTPFLRRLRDEARAEGLTAGQTAGWVAGALAARRRSVLDVLVVRFDPPVSVYHQVERSLETITDESQLAALLAAAIRAEGVADFQATLDREHHQNATG